MESWEKAATHHRPTTAETAIMMAKASQDVSPLRGSTNPWRPGPMACAMG